jgi:mono/diheme cytochrome c family protein
MKLTVLLITLTVYIALSACTNASNTASNTANHSGNSATTSSTAASPTATVDQLATARELYVKNCANCHREDGSGGKVTVDGKELDPEDLTKHKIVAFSDEKILRIINNGIEDEGMPAYKDKLSEAEMREVVRYLRTAIQKVPASPAESPAK